MIYEYECPECGIIEIEQKFGARPITACKECRNPIERLISGGCHAFVKGEATTIGQVAERNSKKMGKYKLQEKQAEVAKQKKQTYTGSLDKDTYNKLSKQTPAQRKKWIMEGD